MNRRSFLAGLAALVPAAILSKLPVQEQAPAPKPGTVSEIRFTALNSREVLAAVKVSPQISEDSAIEFVREVERKIAKAYARNLESSLLNGGRL